MKFLLSWVTYARKFVPTMQCHVGPYFLSKKVWMMMWKGMEGVEYVCGWCVSGVVIGKAGAGIV